MIREQVIRDENGRFIRLIPANHMPDKVARECRIVRLTYDSGYYRQPRHNEVNGSFEAYDVTVVWKGRPR